MASTETAALRQGGFAALLAFYEGHLRDDVMPFWTRHCLDREYGGITNVVQDDGTVTSGDKYIWSQARALWTFSSLFSDFDRDPAWLDHAAGIYSFLSTYGRDPDGAWHFCLHRDGRVAQLPQSVYVDGFAIYGLTQYFRATGHRPALQLAMETYHRVSPLLDDHTTLPTEPHPIPSGLRAHGPSMMFALVFHELGQVTGDRSMANRSLELAELVMTQHVQPQRHLLLEFIHPGGGVSDSDAGGTVIPGHAIESAWFMERIYSAHGRTQRVELARDLLRWHLELGWDADHGGGLLLARSVTGGRPVWHQPEAKVWWPHTEALYALLRFRELGEQPWLDEWYWRLHDYTFSHFPDRDHGDWHQYLDRDGQVATHAISKLAVKDPFHLPRALIYAILSLRRLAAADA